MKYFLSLSIIFFLCTRVIAQDQGNFNGIFNTYNSYEKVLYIPVFPHEVPNLAVDIIIGNISFWGSIEVEITGSYSHQNTPGKVSKIFAVGANPNNIIYTNVSRVTEAIGAVVDNISIGNFKWDAVNSRYSIPVSHVTSTMNDYTVKVKFLSHGYGSLYASQYLSISPSYTLTALPRNYVHVQSDFGVGTANPQNMLHVHGNADGYGYLRISDALTGSGNADGARFGFNSGVLRIQNFENTGISMLVNGSNEALTIANTGNIGVGTTLPSEKLAVNGNVRAKKIIVTQTNWPDYVFDAAYKLPPLKQVDRFITKHKHLPDIPSAKEVEEKGVSVGDQQALLLKKIEELTLYLIKQERQMDIMKKEIKKVKQENQTIKNVLRKTSTK